MGGTAKPARFNPATEVQWYYSGYYERLLNAGERGWKGGPGRQVGKHHQLSSDVAADLIPRYRGFTLTAELRSSRPGLSGQQIQAELWYFPTPPGIQRAGQIGSKTTTSGEVRRYTRRNDSLQRRGSSIGEDIRRVVTLPKMDAERFVAHDTASRNVGFQQLREAMSRPISTPMRD